MYFPLIPFNILNMVTIEYLPSRYRILTSLGKGGIGQVYKVEDTILGHTCALKIINRAEPKSKETLKREFKILSNFQHPNLVRVYDFGFLSEEVPYFTMEYIDGVDLRTFLASESNIDYIHQIIKDILSALCYLHEKGTIHGDIKPENIMIIPSERRISVKLLDFGLAAHLGQKRDGISGTLRFLAPEVISSKQYSAASDLYALGLTLYESITKVQVPPTLMIHDEFSRSMYANLLKALSRGVIKNPSSIGSFILNLSQFKTEDRPQSPKEALQAFTLLCEERDDKPIPSFDEIFIGRKKELSIINSFLANITSSRKSLIIKGIQGIGKKSILRRILKKSQVGGYLVLDLTNDKYNNNSLEHFINDISHNLPHEKSVLFRKAHEKLVAAHSDIGSRYSEMHQKDHALVIFDNIVKHLHELSLDKPVLICMPDIERFPEDFLRFILHLLNNISLLESHIFLLISRNTDIPFKLNAYEAISKDTYSSSLNVGTLTENELSILLKEYLGSIVVPRDDFSNIVQRTHCVPLVIVELTRHLISSGAIVWSYNRWHFDKAAYEDIYIPESTEELIKGKIKDLNREEKYTLQVIAIHDKPIQQSLLVSVSGLDNKKLQEIILALKDIQFIKIEDGIISFFHPIYYKYISKHTPYRKRTEINKAIASIYVNEFPDDTTKIAHHYIEANIPEEALKYGLRSADEMISKFEYYNALHLLNEIYTLIDNVDTRNQRLEVLQRLAPLEHKTGNISNSISHYEFLAKNISDANYKAQFIKQIAIIQSDLLGDAESVISYFNEALSISRSINNKELEAEILMELGCLIGYEGLILIQQAVDISEHVNDEVYAKALARLLYRSAISGNITNHDSIYEQIDKLMNTVDNEVKKDILYNLYMFHFYRGNYEKAIICIKEKVNIEELTDDPIGKIYSLNSFGGICYVQGNFYKQIEILDKALFIARKYNNYLMAIQILSNMLIAYRYLANYKEPFILLKQANSIINEYKIKKLFSAFLLKNTHLFLMFGYAMEDEYKKYLKKTKSRAKHFKNSIIMGHCYLMHSKYHYQNLSMMHACKNCMSALELFTNSNDRDDMVDAYAHMALYLAESREAKAAIENIDRAQSIYNEIHCKYLEPFLLFTKGAAERANNLKSAGETLTQALRTSKKMGTRETTWQIQREIALYYMDKGKLSEALSFYKDAIETIRQITESIEDETLKISYLSVPFRKRVFDEIKSLKQQLN